MNANDYSNGSEGASAQIPVIIDRSTKEKPSTQRSSLVVGIGA